MCVLSFIYSYVQVFDNKTGQETKDEHGKGKVQVVRVLASEEAKFTSFFKWTKHFNNYHLEITNGIFQLRSYHPICYQTKAHDERGIRLTVFCQQERQFLESYRWLCKLPEFFQLKEFFSTIKLTRPKKKLQKYCKAWILKTTKYVVQMAVHYRH